MLSASGHPAVYILAMRNPGRNVACNSAGLLPSKQNKCSILSADCGAVKRFFAELGPNGKRPPKGGRYKAVGTCGLVMVLHGAVIMIVVMVTVIVTSIRAPTLQRREVFLWVLLEGGLATWRTEVIHLSLVL